MSERAVYSIDHSEADSGAPENGMVASSTTPFGRRAFIAGAAGVAAATAVGATAHAAGVPSGASYYHPINPVRLADTRTYGEYADVAKDFQRLSDRSIRINIRNSPYATDVPSDAIAVVVSIAAIYSGTGGYVAAVPAGNTDAVSNINMTAGDGAVANLATVKIGGGSSATNGKIDVRSSSPYDVVVDIVGVYRSVSVPVAAGRMKFLPATRRALGNTRVYPDTWRTVPMDFIPANAQAVVVNLTAADCATGGFLTASAVREPTTGRPKVSNLNFSPGDTRAAAAIVKLGRSGTTPSIEVFAGGEVVLFVDVTGYITGGGDVASDEGLFVPIDPYRVMDTRRSSDFALTGKKRLWPGWSRAFELPNAVNGFGPRTNMAGVVLNATLDGSMTAGFVTVLPARTPRQFVSNLNPTRLGHTVANHVISRVSTSGVEMYCLCGGDVLADVAGWFTGSPQAATEQATVDPPAPAAPFNWLLNVPRMGLFNWVAPNLISGDPVVDSGNTWHWTNTGLLGQMGASIVTFGHRTSGRGPNRYQDRLVSGDAMTLDTPDKRRYTYQFVGDQLTGGSPTAILNAARSNSAGTTFTLVACTGSRTVLNRQALGGTTYRMVSTFVLVGWTDERPQSAG